MPLLLGGGTVDVGRDEERRFLLELEPLGKLAGGGRLARSLEPYHQDDGGGNGRKHERRLRFAEEPDQFVVDDLDQLLSGPDVLDLRDSHRPALHPLQKLAGELEAHVGLEQDAANLPQTFLDGLVGQDAASDQPAERVVESFGQLLEHSP
jgi:hypothetical protein